MKFSRRKSIMLMTLGLALGILNIIFGVNEATIDILDRIGSNYWLAYSATTAGVSLIVIAVILFRRSWKR